MARKPGLWQRDGSDWWYTTVHGKQLKLSRDKKEAERALHELLADPPEPTEGFRPSVGKIADLFLDYSQAHHEPETYKWYKWFLQSFCDHVKKGRKVYDLKVHMVTGWLQAHPKWGDSSKAAAIAIVLNFLNWGVNQGHLNSHPLKGMKRGKTDRRERFLDAAERELVRGAIEDSAFKQFFLFLEQTGCRPFSEAAKITAAQVDLAAGTVTLKKHKTVKKTRRSRVIYLPEAAKATIAYLMALHPEGPLFRSSLGMAWTKEATYGRIKTLRTRIKIEPFTLYAVRHSWITEALSRGLTADVVGELVGSSAATIAKYYNSLDQKKDFLRAAAQQAVGTTEWSSPVPVPTDSESDC